LNFLLIWLLKGSQYTRRQQSFDQSVDYEESSASNNSNNNNTTSLKVKREKFQSKSLKLTGQRRTNHGDVQIQKINLSSLSLPLYSFEDCMLGSSESILIDLQENMPSEQSQATSELVNNE